MIKTIGLVSVVCALAIVGMMWTRQSFQATEPAPAAILQAAATALEFSHRANGTYAGATPDAVTVVWADIRSYCVEFAGSYIAGPSGTPTTGACPRQ